MVLARDIDKEKQPSRTVRINQHANKGLRIHSFFRGDPSRSNRWKEGPCRLIKHRRGADCASVQSRGPALDNVEVWAYLHDLHARTVWIHSASLRLHLPAKRVHWGLARAPVEVASSASITSSEQQERHLARKTRRDPPEATITATSSWCVVRECWSPPC